MVGGLVLVSLAIGVTLVLSSRAATIQLQMGSRVTHALEVREATHLLRVGLGDMERIARLYVITGDESDLPPFYEAVGANRAQLAHIGVLTRDNPVQRSRVREVADLMTRREARLDLVIATRRARGFEAARAEVLTRIGFRLTDSIGAGIRAMRSTEDSVLLTRQDDWIAAARRTQRFQLLTGALVIILVAATMVMLARLTAARRRAQEERERIITLSEDLHCIAGFDGRFRMVNPAWERMLGHPLEELLARPFVDFLHPDDIAPTNATYEQQMREGKLVIDFANRYRHRDGSYRWLQWRAITRQKEGLIYATARDITSLREAEEERRRNEEHTKQLNTELEQSVEELSAVNEELEAFSYSVSHDLRAPLRHISGFSNLLERHAGGVLDEKGKRYLDTVRGAVTHMGALIDDLLTFSRIGRSDVRADPVRLDDVVRATVAEVEEEVAFRNVRLDVRPLPVVRGDAGLLKVVLANLLSNALKYTRPRAEARIEVGTDAPREDRVVVFVRDNGVGFDMQYAGKLFGVFQRLHNDDQFEGTGIGLATVQRIIHRLKGRVWAEGAVDHGATFYIALPPAEPALGKEAS